MACLADVQSRLCTKSPAAVERLFRQTIEQAERRGLSDSEAGARSLFGKAVSTKRWPKASARCTCSPACLRACSAV